MADEVSVGATQGIIWTFVAISTIFTLARMYTRLKIVNKIGLDDYLMVFSLVNPSPSISCMYSCSLSDSMLIVINGG